MSRWWVSVVLAACALAAGCVGQPELVTAPCEAGCNASARVGSRCEVAEDCADAMVCNLAFPGGYCQSSCEGHSGGASCGPEGSGVCLSDGAGGMSCLAVCDPAEPASCGREEASCYTSEIGGGVCHVRCGGDGGCGQAGLACDGEGVCRVAEGGCDGLTDAGCGRGLRCAPSEAGVLFCGLAGARREGEACGRSAECEQGLLCVQGACAARCDASETYTCGELGGCVALDVRTGLGVCPL